MRRWLPLLLFLGACADERQPTRARTDYALTSSEFFAAPFPDEGRRGPDGAIDVSAFGQVPPSDLLERLVTIASEAEDFGTTSTIYLAFDRPLDPGVAAEALDVSEDAGVLLLRIAEGAEPHPIEVRFTEDGGPWGAPNLLSILPLQGMPLEPGARYAAVVRERVRDAEGEPIGRSLALETIARGGTPEGMSEAAASAHREALAFLEARGVDDVAALSVFDTQDPTAPLFAWRETALDALPTLDAPLTPLETHDEFCVYRSTVAMPIYQRGEPPFTDGEGGDVRFEAGAPVQQGTETARVLVTLPRRPMPAGGFPMVVFSRTGGGGDRPLVDRGRRDESGEPVEPGSGPARELAREGWAAISIDGPHGGLRNVTMGDEQLLIFNVANPRAMRDNIRQSAIELVLAAHLGPTLRVDASACEGLTEANATLSAERVVLMGHSMGATIAPLAMAVEPRFDALLLSGAGGSWIENVVHKQSPLPVRPLAEAILGVAGRYELHEHDPTLMLLQWAGEDADPPVYGRFIRDRSVLMMQGIVDTYILPPIANATSLSLALDLGGQGLEDTDERSAAFTPLEPLLPLVGAEARPLPLAGNRGAATAVVTQHPEGPIEDGHEVVFQTEGPKTQYRCFLRTLAAGGPPLVPAVDGSCPM